MGSAGLPKRKTGVGTQPGFPSTDGGPVFCDGERRRIMKKQPQVLTTQEACQYLRISRPTFLRLVYTNQIRAKKVGKGWRVLRSEIETYMRGEDSE
jgi:excisionase family DNA binding protein